jgi:hypothetical protein
MPSVGVDACRRRPAQPVRRAGAGLPRCHPRPAAELAAGFLRLFCPAVLPTDSLARLRTGRRRQASTPPDSVMPHSRSLGRAVILALRGRRVSPSKDLVLPGADVRPARPSAPYAILLASVAGSNIGPWLFGRPARWRGILVRADALAKGRRSTRGVSVFLCLRH